MTEQEFRNYLITNREWLEQSMKHELSLERIEEMVQEVQEMKRLRALKNQNKTELQK